MPARYALARSLTLPHLFTLACCIAAGLISSQALADERMHDAFLQPNLTINLGSFERGRLEKLHVKEGDRVAAGQLLAEFDTGVLAARLKLASAAAAATGSLDSARALVKMRKSRLAMLEELSRSGSARPRELETTTTNLAMAEAQLQAEKENRLLRAAEKNIILAQLEEKRLYSPIAGVVVSIDKHEGELIGAQIAESILTLVQLDPLLAEFNLPPEIASLLTKDMVVPLSTAGTTINSRIVHISPVIDATSDTIRLSCRIANKGNQLIAGSRVVLNVSNLVEMMPNESRQPQAAGEGQL